MANTFKLKTKANVGITTQNVYVVPSATTTVVIGITLANTSGSGCIVGVGITRPSADDVKVLKNVPIPTRQPVPEVFASVIPITTVVVALGTT